MLNKQLHKSTKNRNRIEFLVFINLNLIFFGFILVSYTTLFREPCVNNSKQILGFITWRELCVHNADPIWDLSHAEKTACTMRVPYFESSYIQLSLG